ncbi:hypothetical protein ACTVH1_17375 [Gluconobacter cerinus]
MSDTDKKTSTVFLGSAANMQAMMDPAIYEDMIEEGIGLYGHGNGIYTMAATHQMAGLMSDLPASSTAPGVAEFGMSFGYSMGSVTLTNTGTTTQTIAVGTTFTGSNGEEYVVTSAPGQPGYTSKMTGPNAQGYVSTEDGGYYELSAGKSVTLTLESLTADSTANLSANSITTLNADNASSLQIVSSTEFTGGGSVSENYFTGGQKAPFYYLYQQFGYSPSEGNVNVNEAHLWTENDVTAWKEYVDAARASGVMNMAPILTDNGLTADYSQDFATSAYWATEREAALYGGGLSFDSPAGFFNQFTTSWFGVMGQAADTYINFVESEIRWATSEGLRTSVIIAPFGTNMTDTVESDYLEQVKLMVARLQKDGAMPSQFIVENYNLDTKSNTFDTSASNTESLNAVADYLATVSTVSTNSESGLEVIGQSAADIMMSGNKPQVTAGTGTTTLYDYPQLFATSSSTAVTMTLTLTGGSDLSLVATGGELSEDGRTLTATGTPDELTAILKSLGVDDEALKSGTATLTLDFQDASSSIEGTTVLTYSGIADTGTYTSQAGGTLDMEDTAMNVSVTAGGFTLVGESGSPTLTGPGNATLQGSFGTVVDNLAAGATLTGSAQSISLGDGALLNLASGASAKVALSSGSTLTVTNGASANVTSGTGSSVVQMTGGTVTANLTSGYTTIYEDMSANSQVDLSGFNVSNGLILLTNLNSLSDLHVAYKDGNATLTEAGNSGEMVLHGTNSVSYLSDVGSVNFSQMAGSNALALLTNTLATNVTVSAGQDVSFTATSGGQTVDMNGGALSAILSDSSYTTLNQDFSAGTGSVVDAFTTANGELLATHLDSFDDVSVYYGDGNAVVTNGKSSITLMNTAQDSVGLLQNVGSVNFSDMTGSKTLAIVNQASDGGALTVNSDQTYNASTAASSLVHLKSGDLTANLSADTYTTIDIDMTGQAKLMLNDFTVGNGEILLKGVKSASDLQISYHDNSAYLTSASGAEVVMSGTSHVSLLSSVGMVDFSAMTGQSTMALVG